MTGYGHDFKEVAGYRIPEQADIPEPPSPGHWDRIKSGGESWWYLKADGVIDIGRQTSVERINPGDDKPEVFVQGTDEDGMPHIAVLATVEFDDGVASDIGSTDAMSNDLENMVSTANTRAVRKVIARHLGIIRVGGDGGDGSAVADAGTDYEEGHALSGGEESGTEVPDAGGDDDEW